MSRNNINLTNKNISGDLNLVLVPKNRFLKIVQNGDYCAYSKEYDAAHSSANDKFFNNEILGLCSDITNINIFNESISSPELLRRVSETTNFNETIISEIKEELYSKTILNSTEYNNKVYNVVKDDFNTFYYKIHTNMENLVNNTELKPDIFFSYLNIPFKIPFNKNEARPFIGINDINNIRVKYNCRYNAERHSELDDADSGTVVLTYYSYDAKKENTKESTFYIKTFTLPSYIEQDFIDYFGDNLYFQFFPENFKTTIGENYTTLNNFEFNIPFLVNDVSLNDSSELEFNLYVPVSIFGYYKTSWSNDNNYDKKNGTISFSFSIQVDSIEICLVGPSYKKAPNEYSYSFLTQEINDESKVFSMSNPLINNLNFYGTKESQTFFPIDNSLSRNLCQNFLDTYFFGRQYGDVKTFYSEIRSLNGERVMNGVSGKVPKLNDIVYFSEYLPDMPFIITKCEINPSYGTIFLEFARISNDDNPDFEQEIDSNVVYLDFDIDNVEGNITGDFFIEYTGSDKQNVIKSTEIIGGIETPSKSNYAKNGPNLLFNDGYYWHYKKAKYFNGEEWVDTNIVSQKLRTPIIRINDSIISWANIENANEYFIYSNEEFIGRTTELNYNIGDLTTINYIKIRAMSNSYNYESSDYSNTIFYEGE